MELTAVLSGKGTTGCFIREGNSRLFYQGGNDNRLF
jgi:hypothetical protein